MKFLREYAVTNVGHSIAYFNNEEDALEYADKCIQRDRYATISVYKKINREVVVSQENS